MRRAARPPADPRLGPNITEKHLGAGAVELRCRVCHAGLLTAAGSRGQLAFLQEHFQAERRCQEAPRGSSGLYEAPGVADASRRGRARADASEGRARAANGLSRG